MSTKIDSLTSLRFFAAFAIVVFHANQTFGLFKEEHLNQACLHGVSLFFVLSGFILTTVYFEQNLREPKAWFSFLRKRIGRIWPLHIAALVFQVALVPSSVGLFTFAYIWVLLANLGLVHSWFPIGNVPFFLNPPSWSVSTELFFYLAFPLLLLGARRSVLIPIAFAFISLGTLALLSGAFKLSLVSVDGVSLRNVIYWNPLSRIPEFCAGIVAAVFYRRYLVAVKLKRVSGTLWEIGAFILALSLFISSHPLAESLKSAGVTVPVAYWFKVAGIPLVGCTVLILTLAMRQGALSKLLCAPLLVLLGEISYSTYLLHVPLLMGHHEYCEDLTSLADLLIFLAILFPLSHIFYTVIEKPMRELIGSPGAFRELIGGTGSPRESLSRIAKEFGSPSRILVVAESVLVVLLMLAIPAKISSQSLLSEASGSAKLNRQGCQFEAVEMPLSCKVIPNLNTGEIDLVWRAASDVELEKYWVLVTLLTRENKYIACDNEPISQFHVRLKQGQVWTSSVKLPALCKRRAERISIMLRKDNTQPEKICVRQEAGPTQQFNAGPQQIVLTRDQLSGRSAVATTDGSI